MRRVESLDYLRGMMAICIMLYHYVAWTSATPSGLLGKIGVYGVSIFFVLSGLSLTIAYKDKITSKFDIAPFLIRRVFRIFPVLWVAITADLFLRYIFNKLAGIDYEFDLYQILINYSLMFGFIDHDNYIAVGSWSIGNEMVFYTLFPFIMLFARRPLMILLLFVVSLGIGGYCSLNISNQTWSLYINPLNQLMFFVAGMVIGFVKIRSAVIPYILAAIGLGVFLVMPMGENNHHIYSGLGRMTYTASVILFVAGIYFINPILKNGLHRLFMFLGEACYSIYLLHPIIAKYFIKLCMVMEINTLFAYYWALVFILPISWLSYRYLEKPMMDMGKIIANGIHPKIAAL